jgi:hypothetical protein
MLTLRCTALSALALTLALGTSGCVGDESDLIDSNVAAVSGHHDPPPPPVSSVTQLPDGRFRFVSTAIVAAPVGRVWTVIRDIEQVVQIALPGIASDFTWVNGGSAQRVPSEFQFAALGATVHEEVFDRSVPERTLRYRLVVPALGLQTYVGTMQVEHMNQGRSRLTFSRDIRFDDPASAPSFATLFEQEIASLQAHFND